MQIEDGVYRARAVSAGLGEAGTGNVQVGIEFKFLDVEGSMTYYGTFTERAMEHTLKAMRNAGWKGDDVSDLSSLNADDAPEVSLTVANEEYNGNVSPKIKWVNKPGGLAMKTPLSADQAKVFAAKLRGSVLAFDRDNGTRPTAKPAPRPSAPSRQPEPPPLDDKDMPPF